MNTPKCTYDSAKGATLDGASTPVRLPSPVPHGSWSSSSTPRSVAAQGNEYDAHHTNWQPSFTVVSSTYIHTNDRPLFPKGTLNPAAKEFQLPARNYTHLATTDTESASFPMQSTLFAKPALQQASFAPYAFGSHIEDEQCMNFMTTTPTIVPATDEFPHHWAGGAHHRYPTMMPAGVPLGEASVHEPLLQYIHKQFRAKCEADGEHMVAVLNLEPCTTKEQLLDTFFPMGASDAAILDLSKLPADLAGTCFVGRRSAGVAFFSQKDFAMMGVQKFDNFMPKGQYQPLVVRYCGPDSPRVAAAGDTLLNGDAATETGSLRSETAQHGVPSSRPHDSAVPKSPVKVLVQGLDGDVPANVLRNYLIGTGALFCKLLPMKGRAPGAGGRDVEAVVLYPTEEVARAAVSNLPKGAPRSRSAHPSATLLPQSAAGSHLLDDVASLSASRSSKNADPVPHLAPKGLAHELSVISDSAAPLLDIDRYFMAKYPDSGVHLVVVHNLTMQTDKQALYKIFYPMGARDAELYPSVVATGGKRRRSGVAVFTSQGMATEAAVKIDNFVPLGQTRPLRARYLLRDKQGGGASTPRRPQGSVDSDEVCAASTPRPDRCVDGAPTLPLNASVPDILRLIEDQLAAPVVDANVVAALMTELARRSEWSQEVADQLGEQLSAFLVGMRHPVMLATPLSGALLKLHENLNIQRRLVGSRGEREQKATEKPVQFVLRIARAVMLLLTNEQAPQEARQVAAVLCGYLFSFHYMPHSPYLFSVELLRKHTAELREAKEFLSREADTPSTPEEERRNRPWITLVECLMEMTSLWRQQNQTRAKRDESRKDYQHYITDFYSRKQANSSNQTSRSATPAAEAQGGTPSSNCGRRAALVTPSARPTPRRVVVRQSPCGAVGSGGRGAAAAGRTVTIVPRVVLSPGSDNTQGISTDISLESNCVPNAATTNVLRSMGIPLTVGNTAFHSACGRSEHDAVSAATTAGGLDGVSVSLRAAPDPVCVQNIQPARSDTPDCTVYITKLPAHFKTGQLRRLLCHFGEFNKVRVYHDDKENMIPPHLSAGHPTYTKLCFCFVEFVLSSSAKAMVEYFRNAVHKANSFDFLCDNAETSALWKARASSFSDADITLLKGTRASRARNPIHDHCPSDAVLRSVFPSDSVATINPGALIRLQPCRFGDAQPNLPIEQYNESRNEGSTTSKRMNATAALPQGAPIMTAPSTPGAASHEPLVTERNYALYEESLPLDHVTPHANASEEDLEYNEIDENVQLFFRTFQDENDGTQAAEGPAGDE